MTLSEYLHTSFENPDPEFFDGEVVERNGGTLPHSSAMGEFAYRLHEVKGLCVVISIRLRVSVERVRVADVAAFEREPAEEVPSTTPLLCVEILSPEDRMGDVVRKLEEYRRWGVRHIWLADPDGRKFFT